MIFITTLMIIPIIDSVDAPSPLTICASVKLATTNGLPLYRQ